MTKRLAINGFGRIGRNVFRILQKKKADMEVVAINDLTDAETLAYLLKYDSVHGRFDGEVEATDNGIKVNGEEIEVTSEKDPANLGWDEKGVDIVIEATGVFRKKAQLEKHLEAGADKVILTVPAKDKIDNTIVLGVNDDELKDSDRIVSNASCTTNCLAPLAKVLNDKFGIEKGLITTVHGYTASQAILDAPMKKTRRGRAAAENIIPTTTGAAIATTKVLPELEGKIDGMAMRVPVPDGSIVDGVFNLSTDVTEEEVNAALKEAAEGEMEGVLGYTEDEVVSRDIIGSPYSSLIDAQSTKVIAGNQVKVLSWYDNEWGYSNRVVDLAAML
ncbi:MULTISPECIES: type I glyceraldehyde-3-phosphate dehydrogenase [unclassified Candidatus Frackibacter]|jgi:glyceraldehyde 3-phosphate dehydrogenase|uniref:type I glyceraldehyde-3-phosphate dehydrogenase n=1 Tax=unclassified Candidatus Frackibacter TaxID=2648818 RepID=UPI000793F9DE|nr:MULTISPECIES: type I glyceraldehyde-3-phosphate dehydrogenase [unclassified Candidatus Frackibacter]KXS43306.1 MAG: glyceraldehyde 3-phosphate dehydrogenase [Candidatus Frackibacter sp. T328-2]SDC70334.1 glyceraldehyde-3-phosphate dehydrogenase (NAD+) [Candidatus Frackibacter sp. WG11]SEM85172.1 glyceraldehyde-3-phosphate dehydrogenase (NAD+) [Candidatus Frackibacter sp. WG12]SFL94403.1 glyceraldehyde-3-phosphate dehydrogenase (NAD+) [Candidatus Frackibacter sp. WG13]